MPVLPPTAASTAPKSVVGIFMNGMPRLNVDAAKAPISVTTPPPRFITTDLPVAPPSPSCFHIIASVSIFLNISPALVIITFAPPIAFDSLCRRGSTNEAVLTSAITKTEVGAIRSTASSTAWATWLVKIIVSPEPASVTPAWGLEAAWDSMAFIIISSIFK